MLVEMFLKVFFQNHSYWNVFENLTFQNLPALRYHIFTSSIQYYKLRTVFGIPRYLIKQAECEYIVIHII